MYSIYKILNKKILMLLPAVLAISPLVPFFSYSRNIIKGLYNKSQEALERENNKKHMDEEYRRSEKKYLRYLKKNPNAQEPRDTDTDTDDNE
jgi:hypothetical protein